MNPTPKRIEQIRYNQGFRLVGGEQWEIYTLVDTHEKTVKRGQPLKIKDTHGRTSFLDWGTEVLPLID